MPLLGEHLDYTQEVADVSYGVRVFENGDKFPVRGNGDPGQSVVGEEESGGRVVVELGVFDSDCGAVVVLGSGLLEGRPESGSCISIRCEAAPAYNSRKFFGLRLAIR